MTDDWGLDIPPNDRDEVKIRVLRETGILAKSPNGQEIFIATETLRIIMSHRDVWDFDEVK